MKRETKTAIIFILPLVLLAFSFMLFPVLGTFSNSLWKDVSFLPRKFIGLSNYINIFRDSQFWQSLRFTLIFSVASVSIEIVLGMIFALVVHERFRMRWLVRGIVLLPWAIPSIVGSRIWQLIYQYEYGLANAIVVRAGGAPVNWLGTSWGAFWSLVMTDVWRTAPFVTIILLAGLQAIPQDVYKQARIDGAGFFKRFTGITLPLLKPILIVALLFRTIDALRVFDVIYVITGGGPGGSTASLSLYGYKYFLLGDFGYGSAVSIVLFLIAFITALIYIKYGKFHEATL